MDEIRHLDPNLTTSVDRILREQLARAVEIIEGYADVAVRLQGELLERKLLPGKEVLAAVEGR